MSQQSKEVVLKLYHYIDQGDFENTKRLLHKDFVEFGSRDTIDQFIQKRMAFFAAFPDGKHVFDDVFAEGDKVATVGWLLGTHKGPFMGVAPTNKPVRIQVWHLNRVAGGKILEHRAVADMLGLMRQVGAVANG